MAFGTREELRRALLRLVGTEEDDPELTLRGETSHEVLDIALEQGLWKAQRYLIDIGLGDEWLASATPTFAAADATGARSADVEPDFLRLDALYGSSGSPWGRLLTDTRKRRAVSGNWYYYTGGKLWLAPQASPPEGLSYDYYQRLALPAAGGVEVVNLPEDARVLVPAEAAFHAMHETWIPAVVNDQFEARIARNRLHQRVEVAAAMRRTTGRQEMHDPVATGSHYWM